MMTTTITTPCQADPDRWSDPDPADVAARLACQQCPLRRSCASEALRLHAEGLWAGVLVPPYRKNSRPRGHALTHLAHIAGLEHFA